mgnify:CR=1 FL=1
MGALPEDCICSKMFLLLFMILGKEKDYRKFHILKESWMKRLGSIIRYPAKPALVEVSDGCSTWMLQD